MLGQKAPHLGEKIKGAMHVRLSLDPFEQLPLTRTVRASSGRNLRVKSVRRLEKLLGKLK